MRGGGGGGEACPFQPNHLAWYPFSRSPLFLLYPGPYSYHTTRTADCNLSRRMLYVGHYRLYALIGMTSWRASGTFALQVLALPPCCRPWGGPCPHPPPPILGIVAPRSRWPALYMFRACWAMVGGWVSNRVACGTQISLVQLAAPSMHKFPRGRDLASCRSC